MDERQADKGKLLLEVKATALGLVPDLAKIVNLAPQGFEADKVADQGVSVARFDPDSEFGLGLRDGFARLQSRDHRQQMRAAIVTQAAARY